MGKNHKRKGNSGCKYHPSRISGRQKLIRQQAHEEYLQKKGKKNGMEPIDTSRNDWSLKND